MHSISKWNCQLNGSCPVNFFFFLKHNDSRVVLWVILVFADKFDYASIEGADSFFGPVFFLVYMVVVSFILINMFLSIIMETFTVVKQDLTKQDNEYEIVEFIMNRLKGFFGIGNAVDPRRELLQNRRMAYVDGKYKT